MRSKIFTVAQANATIPAVQACMARIIQLRGRASLLHHKLAAAGYPVKLEDDAQLTLLITDDIEADCDNSPERDPIIDLPEQILRNAGKLRALYATIADEIGTIEQLGAVLENIEEDLIEWPASYDGREIWLSWRFGENQVNFWHEFRGGVGDARPVAELERVDKR